MEARHNAAVYGLTGEVSFFRVKRLRVFDFTCMDLPALSYGLHICTFEDIVLERLTIEGRKDAVHLGTGKHFVIRHGLFRTFDDPIALNAHDYAVANPQMGWIEDGLIEDCYDLADRDTTGYFCRIGRKLVRLAGGHGNSEFRYGGEQWKSIQGVPEAGRNHLQIHDRSFPYGRNANHWTASTG